MGDVRGFDDAYSLGWSETDPLEQIRWSKQLFEPFLYLSPQSLLLGTFFRNVALFLFNFYCFSYRTEIALNDMFNANNKGEPLNSTWLFHVCL